jgi:hypothetical protein
MTFAGMTKLENYDDEKAFIAATRDNNRWKKHDRQLLIDYFQLPSEENEKWLPDSE